MKTLIRTSIVGNEYWDNVEKKIIFVPNGQTPNFEVVDNPESMINHEEQSIVGIDLSTTESFSVSSSGEVLDSEGNVREDHEEPGEEDKEDLPGEDESDSDEVSIENMNIKELRKYAKQADIDIPSAIRSKGDIITIIKEAE